MADKPTNQHDSPLKRLRSATAELHTALEQIVDWNRVFSGAENYLRLLLAYRRIVEPADAVIAELLKNSSSLPDAFEPRVRTQWLINDIEVVLADVATEAGREKPLQIEQSVDDFGLSNSGANMFQSMETIASAIGVQYVLEGSSLGGQILSKQLINSLGYTPVNGGRFFAGYGDQISRNWKDFSNWGNRNLTSERDVVQAEQAATYTFRCFMESFTELANE